MNAKQFAFVLCGLCLGIASACAQDQGSNTRYLTTKPGFWQPQHYRGEHGAGATPAESHQIDANLKAIQDVLIATPIGASPVGFYYLPSPMWFSKRGQPILQGLGIYPLALAEFRKQGVWTLDMHGETESAYYNLNDLSEIERVSTKIFYETGPDGSGPDHLLFTVPPTVGKLGGFPVYGDTLFIARPGREIFVPVTVEHALKFAMPTYARNRDGAEHDLVEKKKQNQEFQANYGEYEQKELAEFEKQWGYVKATDVKEYEEHKRQWMAPVLRNRQEHEAAAALPVRGNKDSEWYFNAIDGYDQAQKRLASLSAEEAAAPACYKPLDLRLPYAMRGEIHSSGTGGPDCVPIVETNQAYYDRSLPRSAAQLITVTSITRCASFRGGTLNSTSEKTYSGGCRVHAQMWKEVDWQKLADLLVK